MANEKITEALSYIALGLRLATEALEEEAKVRGASTEEINARASTLHEQIKKALAEDSAKDRAEMQKS